MAEVTDSPVVSRLFTQGRHRNASVILLLQNMFEKNIIHFMSAYYKETEKPFGYLLAHQPISKLASTAQYQSQKPARKKSMQTITWSDVPINE